MDPFQTKTIRSLAEFQANQAQWNQLYERSGQHQATGSHELVMAYWQDFLPSEQVQVHVVIDPASDQWVAALPTFQRRWWGWLPTVHNFSSPWCLGVVGLLSRQHDHSTLVKKLLTSIRQSGAMMLTLDLVSSDDPFVQALRQVGSAGEHMTNTLELFRVGKTMLEPAWETFIKEWSKKRRRFIRRACDQLAEVGSFQMKPLHQSTWSEVESAWNQCLQVESLGWKGQNGSDLASNPAAKSYYGKILQHLYQSGELRFYSLELNGRLIAYDLGYLRGRVATSLKVSYHPEFTDYSPGHVLNSLVIQDLIAQHETDWIDTVGELNEANSKWCRENYSCQRIEVSLGSWASRTTLRSREWLRAIKRQLTSRPQVSAKLSTSTSVPTSADEE
jgi:CelD/BcsL family acetyltransferase involved in cellulose biosynthesis